MPHPKTTLRAAIFGATGTAGVELAALLAEHPHVQLVAATSRDGGGRSLREVDPAAPDLPLCTPDEVDRSSLDVAFLALPHGTSAPEVERCVAAGALAIDLSGDFRLRDEALHQEVYGVPRDADLAARAVYGLSEHAREQLPGARLVANPGCYATCTALPLAPLAAAGLLPELVTVDGKSGISGAGRAPTAGTHYLAVADEVRAYQVGDTHRHVPEVHQLLALRGAPNTFLVFCPHVVPMARGILVTAVLPGVDAAEAHEVLTAAYRNAPFVEVLPLGQAASVRAVTRTNRAQIGVHPTRGATVLTSSLDNLIKGAAGQAVQNMNLVLGLPEIAGLRGARAVAAS